MTKKFQWADFYKEFAMRILPYETCRKEMINQMVEGFKSIGVELPDGEKFENLEDIDPFTVIGLCNRSLPDEQRTKIAETVQRIFYVDAFLPTEYDGISTLDGFFYEGDMADEEALNNLWELFHYGLVYDLFQSEDSRINLEKYFNLSKEIEGMDEEKLKMGLFWILPNMIKE